ncbi:MAG: DUF1735 domain-containing protein [Bacteroidales bacterium]|nr:DUF1735 domain-containing protein [Bacteroidales bacterium]
MKINNLFMLSGVMLLGTMAFTSCSEDETFDVDGANTNAIFFTPTQKTVQENLIYNTPAGVFGNVAGSFTVKSQYPLGSNLSVSAVADNTLVEEFNKKNGSFDKVYKELPASVLSAAKISATSISAGSQNGEASITVEIPSDVCSALTDEWYVLPLQMQIGTADKGSSSYTPELRNEYTTVYATIHNDMKNFIYTSGNFTQNAVIVQTPVGTFGNIDKEFTVGVRANNDAKFIIQAEVDNSAIAAYNDNNGTEYAQLPDEVLEVLEITDGVIEAGETTTSTKVRVYAAEEAVAELDGEYLLPLKLTFVYPNGTKTQIQYAYVVVKTMESLINDDAQAVPGVQQNPRNMSNTWKLVSSDNFTVSTWSNMFASSVSSRYFGYSGPAETATCVIDLGDVHKVSAFAVYSYVCQNFDVELSEDGENWTSLGSTSGHKSLYTGSQYWFSLYGAVSGRYMRITSHLDQSSFYWQYLAYGTYYARYCGLARFNVAYDD